MTAAEFLSSIGARFDDADAHKAACDKIAALIVSREKEREAVKGLVEALETLRRLDQSAPECDRLPPWAVGVIKSALAAHEASK